MLLAEAYCNLGHTTNQTTYAFFLDRQKKGKLHQLTTTSSTEILHIESTVSLFRLMENSKFSV